MPPELPEIRARESYNHSWVECESWEKFKTDIMSSLFDSNEFNRNRFLFRGHRSFEWPLKPSFDRWYRGERGNKEAVAKRLIELFIEEAEGIDIERSVWTDHDRVIALAQHHGMPTRLLDWSESPYVAAFFAFAGVVGAVDNATHVGIWCLDRSQRNVWADASGAKILRIPTYANERSRNQLGWFSLLTAPYDTLEEHVQYFSEAPNALRQYQIPTADSARALADLELMGISYSRIYPGLEGSAKTAELRGRRELVRHLKPKRAGIRRTIDKTPSLTERRTRRERRPSA